MTFLLGPALTRHIVVFVGIEGRIDGSGVPKLLEQIFAQGKVDRRPWRRAGTYLFSSDSQKLMVSCFISEELTMLLYLPGGLV